MHRVCIPLALLFTTGCGHISAEKRAWEACWKAPQSVAIPKIQEEGITSVPGHGHATFLGAQYGVKAGVVSECYLGAVSIRDRRFYFMELNSSGWRRDVETVAHRSVHGVLGTDLLAELGAIIDYERGCLILTWAPNRVAGQE